MKKKIVLVTVVFLACCALGENGFGQENKPPLTKQEILQSLKSRPGRRFEQGDLAGEIAQRGIAFQADEKTIDELRKAGARSFLIDAIKQAAESATRPQPQQQAQVEAPANVERPRLQQQTATEPPAPTDDDERAARAAALARLPILEQARYHAAEFMDELPNFIVTQFVTRSVRTPDRKDWQVEDKLEVELTYRIKSGEQFKLVRYNDKPTEMSYKDLKGATSTGEFGSMLAALFSPESHAEFKEVRRETFREHPTVVYDFKVKKAFSSNQITDKTSGRTITTAYSGTVWIEAETSRVLRIEQSSEDIQRGFPITMAESAVEYDWVTIEGRRYLLPVYAEVIMGSDPERYYSRNVIELRNYHIFETEMKIIPEKDPPQ